MKIGINGLGRIGRLAQTIDWTSFLQQIQKFMKLLLAINSSALK